jgi:hypothetical protein
MTKSDGKLECVVKPIMKVPLNLMLCKESLHYPSSITSMHQSIFLLFVSGFTLANAQNPVLTSWHINQGETGSYFQQGNSTPVTSTDSANVLLIQYTNDDVYITSNGIPDYPTGPFLDGNPSQAGANDYIFRIPRNPVMNGGTPLGLGLGHIGVLRNGVPIFNPEDAMSYNNQGIWLRNAVYWENDGMDCSKGHPAPNMAAGLTAGFYHHHQAPVPFTSANVLLSSICNLYPGGGLYSPDPSMHGPLIGYAFDGFPIYGSFGFDDPNDPNSQIVRVESSYQERSMVTRDILPNGTILPAGQVGPPVSASYPLGAFIQDYEFVSGSGHLDEHNGRYGVTPEYPNGIYAYFATLDNSLNSDYPYFIGDSYYGVVATDNFGTPGPGNPPTNVSIPGNAQTYSGSTSVMENISVAVVVYPNPADRNVQVELPSDMNGIVMVRDMQGGLIIEKKFDRVGSIRLDVGEYSSGLYHIAVVSDVCVQSIPIVIER